VRAKEVHAALRAADHALQEHAADVSVAIAQPIASSVPELDLGRPEALRASSGVALGRGACAEWAPAPDDAGAWLEVRATLPDSQVYLL
jgi:hypothetical protein